MRETKDKVLEELGIYNPGEEPKAVTTNSGTGKKRFIFFSSIFLILIIISAVGYIGYDKYQENMEAREIEIFEEGVQYASNQIRLALFNEALTCTTIPINNGSFGISLIATRCLTAPFP